MMVIFCTFPPFVELRNKLEFLPSVSRDFTHSLFVLAWLVSGSVFSLLVLVLECFRFLSSFNVLFASCSR